MRREVYTGIKPTSSIFYLILIVAYLPFGITFGIRLIKEDALDFPSFYYATQLAFREQKSPYLPAEWRAANRAYASQENEIFPFLCIPSSLLFFSPFLLVNYNTARIIILGLNHILTFLFIYILLFKIFEEKAASLFSAFFIIYLYSFFPLAATIYYGQINLLIAVLVCLAWYFLKQRFHPIAIAIPISLAILIKLYPALLLIPIAIHRNYKAIFWTIFLLLISTITSYFIFPNTFWPDWFTNVLSSGYNSKILGLETTNPANQSLNGLLLRTFMGHGVRFEAILTPRPWVTSALPLVLSGGMILLSMIVSYLGSKKRMQNNIDLQFSFWLLVTFMVAPISWNHHLVMVLPAIFVLSKYCLDNGPNRVSCLVVYGMALFLAYNYPFSHPAFREGYKTLLISGQLYAIALLWLTTLVLLLQKDTLTT